MRRGSMCCLKAVADARPVPLLAHVDALIVSACAWACVRMASFCAKQCRGLFLRQNPGHLSLAGMPL